MGPERGVDDTWSLLRSERDDGGFVVKHDGEGARVMYVENDGGE